VIIIPSNTSAALPPVSAPVTFVGSAIARASTLTIPAHTAGDIICASAYIETVDTPLSLGIPAGWTTTMAANTAWTHYPFSVRWGGYRTAAGSGTSFGTFTNATHVGVHVFRPTGANGGFIKDWGTGAGYYGGFNGTGTDVPFTATTADPYAGAGTWGNSKIAYCVFADRGSTISLRSGTTQSASSTWCKAVYASFTSSSLLLSSTLSPTCNWAAHYWQVWSNSPAA